MSRHGDLSSRFARLPLAGSAVALLVAVALLLLAAPAEAATYTWKNASATTDFNLFSNWNTALPGASDYGVFSGSATVQPALTASSTVSGLIFSGSNYTLSGAASTLTLTSVATGSGAAALTLSGSSNTVATNLFLSAASGTQQFLVAGSSTNSIISGTISGGNAAARLYLDGASTTRIIALSNTTNSFASGVLIGNVTARVSSIGMANGNSSLGTSGTVTFLAATSFLDYTGSGETSDKTFALAGGNGSEGRISTATGPLTLTGNFFSTTAGAKTLYLNPSSVGTITVTGTIADGTSGSLAVYIGPTTGGAVATLTNPNSSFSGGVTIRGAALAAPQFGMSGFNSPLGTSGTIRLGDSGLAASSSGNNLIYTGFGETTDKRLAFGANTSATVLTLTQNGEGTLTLSDTNPILHSNAFAKTFTLTGGGMGVLAAAIGDVNASGTANTSLTKSGAGTWTLTGSNTFSGSTSINAGVLQVSNTAALASGPLVLNGGALAAQADIVLNRNLDLTNVSGLVGFTGTSSISVSGTILPTYLANDSGGRYVVNDITGANKSLTLNGLNLSTGTGAATRMFLGGRGNTTITGLVSSGTGSTMTANIFAILSAGTTTLSGSGSYTGLTSLGGGGTVILDYSTNAGAKFSGTAALRVADAVPGSSAHGASQTGADLVIKDATSNVTVGQVDVGLGTNFGGMFNVAKTGTGTGVFVMNAITVGRYNALNFRQSGIATTTTALTNGVLAFTYNIATVEGDFATVSSGTITALTGQAALPASAGSNATNYLLSGGTTLTAAVSAYTLDIASTSAGQSLNLGNKTLTISKGLVYGGEGDRNYTISTGTLTFGNTGGVLLRVQSGTLTFDAPLSNSTDFNVSGSGMAVFNATSPSTSANRVTVQEGVVRTSVAVPFGGPDVYVSASPAGAAFELTNSVTVTKNFWLAGTGIGGGGALRNISGNNTLSGSISNAVYGSRINSDAGLLTLSGTVTSSPTAVGYASTNTAYGLTFGGAGNTRVSGLLTGSGAIYKDGAGRLELTGSNTNTGLVRVNGGELKVNGSIAASTAGVTNPFYVAAGATVSGTGTINSQAYFDGTLAPGNSPGSITYTNDVVWSGSSTWNFELSGTGAGQYDQALITNGGGFYRDTGIVGSDAAGYYKFDFLNTGTAGTFRLVDWSGTTNFATANFGYQNLASGLSGTFNVDNTESALFFTVTSSGPASATYALGIGAAAQTIIQGGSTLVTGTLDNTGPDGGDAIGYTGFSGTSSLGSFALSPAAGTVNSKTAATGTGSFTTNTPGIYTITPAVASATNSILGTAATLTNTGSVQINVLDHATPAFTSTVSSTLALNFGTVAIGDAVAAQTFLLTNLSGSAGTSLTAGLQYLGTGSNGDGFTLSGATFASLAASGTSSQFSLAFNPTTTGTFTRSYTLSFQDGGGYSGATATSPLTVSAIVVVVPEPATILLAGIGVGLAAWALRRRRA